MITRKELLAVVAFTQHFRTYLLGQPFKLRTDHGSLSWLCNFKDPTGQLARWLEQLQEFHFEVIHRKGLTHQNADALSRRPQENEQGDSGHHEGECDYVDPVAIPHIATTLPQTTDHDSSSTPPGDIREAQLADNITGPILRAKESTPQKPHNGTLRGTDQKLCQLSSQWDQLTVLNGVLYHTHESNDGKSTHLQLIVPASLQTQILQEVHGGKSSGHLGEEKTLAKLRERFYWPGMTTSVHEWCQTCHSCMSRKRPQRTRRGALENIKAGYPLEIMAMDIVGPLPTSKSGNKYILVISDYFTKWAEAFGIPNQEAITVATKLVDHVFCRLSMPTQLHSDMGAQFESQLIKDISGLLGIKKTHITPYHPQSDGLVERLNRTILSMLATTVKDHGEEWEVHLAKVCFAYNTSIHKSTGFTPFYLMYRRQARILIDLIYSTPEPSDQSQGEYARNLRQSLEKAYSTARERLQTAAQCQKTNYDQCIHGEPFKVGYLVYLHNPVVPKGKSRKLHCPWTGPFSVIKRISDNVYHIQDTNNKKKR